MVKLTLDNPLFDLYVESMVPYVQRHIIWHQKFAERHGREFDVERDGWTYLSWDIGQSPEAHIAVREAVRRAPERTDEELEEVEAIISPFSARHANVTKYAWAIPTERAIETIAKHAPAGVVEIGAGTGYWARFLRYRGTFVAAYDEAPHDNIQAQADWSYVEVGGPEMAAQWPQLALFLCWPPYNTPMALESLHAYCGDTLIYVGEGEGGCNADDAFHEELERDWKEVEYTPIPQWPGIHDGLTVYKRG